MSQAHQQQQEQQEQQQQAVDDLETCRDLITVFSTIVSGPPSLASSMNLGSSYPSPSSPSASASVTSPTTTSSAAASYSSSSLLPVPQPQSVDHMLDKWSSIRNDLLEGGTCSETITHVLGKLTKVVEHVAALKSNQSLSSSASGVPANSSSSYHLGTSSSTTPHSTSFQPTPSSHRERASSNISPALSEGSGGQNSSAPGSNSRSRFFERKGLRVSPAPPENSSDMLDVKFRSDSLPPEFTPGPTPPPSAVSSSFGPVNFLPAPTALQIQDNSQQQQQPLPQQQQQQQQQQHKNSPSTRTKSKENNYNSNNNTGESLEPKVQAIKLKKELVNAAPKQQSLAGDAILTEEDCAGFKLE